MTKNFKTIVEDLIHRNREDCRADIHRRWETDMADPDYLLEIIKCPALAKAPGQRDPKDILEIIYYNHRKQND